MLRRI
jgi:hypothetical protein